RLVDHINLHSFPTRRSSDLVAKSLGRQFSNLNALRHASLEQLTNTEDVGEVIAKSLFDWFGDPRNQQLLERLSKAGLNFESQLRSEEHTSELQSLRHLVCRL